MTWLRIFYSLFFISFEAVDAVVHQENVGKNQRTEENVVDNYARIVVFCSRLCHCNGIQRNEDEPLPSNNNKPVRLFSLGMLTSDEPIHSNEKTAMKRSYFGGKIFSYML